MRIGDPWSFLVLQEAFFGVRRFDAFQRNLGIARNTLTNRLERLVDFGLLTRLAYQTNPVRHEYRLSPQGLHTYPYALALMRFGDDCLTDEQGGTVELYHTDCGQRLRPQAVCNHCKREVNVAQVSIELDESDVLTADPGLSLRTSSRPELYTAGRPTSVGRTLAMIGDRWGLSILWLTLAGVNRFDSMHRLLGISRTVLTARLERLLVDGMLERRPYQQRPLRHDYRLTEKGEGLLPVLLTLYELGVLWGGSTRATQVRHLVCGCELHVHIVCGHCHTAVDPHRVQVVERLADVSIQVVT